MKRYLLIWTLCAMSLSLIAQDLQMSNNDFFDPTRKEVAVYDFSVEYRLEAGYVNNWQHSLRDNKMDLYLHGFRLGMTFDFMLPYRFSMQTGLLYTFGYGTQNQGYSIVDAEDAYAKPNHLHHQIMEHWLTIPARAYYNIKLWKQLNLFFFTGPQLQIGLAQKDNMDAQVTDLEKAQLNRFGVPTDTYDRFRDKELWPVNIQWGLGGGIEWDAYRLQAGYDFGLNNQVRHKLISKQHMWEWSWFVSFAYKLPL